MRLRVGRQERDMDEVGYFESSARCSSPLYCFVAPFFLEGEGTTIEHSVFTHHCVGSSFLMGM